MPASAAGTKLNVSGFTVEPSLDLRYDPAKLSGYRESGGGVFGVTVAGATHQALRAGLGARVSRTYTLENGVALEPDAPLRWHHEILDPGYAISPYLGWDL